MESSPSTPMGRGRGRGRAAAPVPEGPPRREPPPSEEVRAPIAGRGASISGFGAQQFEPPTEERVEQSLQGLSLDSGDGAVGRSDASRGRSRGRGFSGRQPEGSAGLQTGRGPGLSTDFDSEAETPPRRPTTSGVGFEKFEDAAVSPPPEETAKRNSSSPIREEKEKTPEREEEQEATQEDDSVAPVETGIDGSRSVGSTSRSKKKELELPVIHRIGTKGKLFEAGTNYLRLRLDHGRQGVVEYHVSFDYPLESPGLRRKVLKQFDDNLGPVRSFDGMVLFLPYILENDVTVLEGFHPNDGTIPVKVTITFIKVKPMKDAIVFFNILLRRVMLELGYAELRREFYDVALAQKLLQHKMEIWPGTNVTAENQEDGLMICVDSTSRVLRTETVYQYLLTLRGDPKMKEKFTDFIMNKIVLTRYNNKCYKIDDVAWHLNPSLKFEFRKGEITFADYFKNQYNLNIRDMEQPMLISNLKPRKNERFKDAEEQRIAALVPELCYITGLTDDQRSNFKVMTDLATSTRLTPTQRMENMRTFVNRLLSNERVSQILGDWGLSIERETIAVQGRKVEGPTLIFNQRLKTDKTGPDFSRESGMGVYEPIEIKRFLVLCTQRDQDKAKQFIDMYKQVTKPLGIRMLQQGEIIQLRGHQPHNMKEALSANCDPSKVQFVVVIMPMQRDDVYGAIKKFCVVTTPIPSQCILSKTLGNEKRMRSIVLKIALQINCKLSGSLWALQMPIKEDVMFVGIDAAHDPLKKDASVICLVATLNNECTKYYSRSTTSKVHQELADCTRIMMKDALKRYLETRGKYPDRIIIFRDGGSVGALEQIEVTEMNQLKSAVDECNPPVKHFSFVIVAKRIPQRFFRKVQEKRYENPEPGSVFDSTVTLRHLYDFYLVSQQVRQGTVNPTHFIVVDTGDDIKPDLLQKFAYVTTFMYYNWAGTVRVPAMVQYAHKLAALLSKHVRMAPHEDISNTLYYL